MNAVSRRVRSFLPVPQASSGGPFAAQQALINGHVATYTTLMKPGFSRPSHLPPVSSSSSSFSLKSIFAPLAKYSLRKRHAIGGRLMIIGSGWAGFKILENIDQRNFDVVVVSPRNHFVFTPLLASTSVGTLEFRCISEPVRSLANNDSSHSSSLEYYEAYVKSVDLVAKRVECVSALEQGKDTFSLGFDKLIIACGALPNTFNIPGVKEYAHFLKEIQDARRIRYRIMECFEQAQQPGMTSEKIEQLLHFVVVGGGPTGIEFSAELHDFITEDLAKAYPQLMSKVKITIFDVAPKILSMFDVSLSDYTSQKFARKGIQLRTGTSVVKVNESSLELKDGSLVPYGLLVWSTGLAQNPLIQSMEAVGKDKRSGRLLTDPYLRVVDSSDAHRPIPDVYAVGDCGTIINYDLPCTAQVAKQKAKYLSAALNKSACMIPIENGLPFSYRDMGSMAYIGKWRAIAGLTLSSKRKWNESGIFAWILWRSAYFTMSVSLKNKILIPIYWLMTWIFGRDITHIK